MGRRSKTIAGASAVALLLGGAAVAAVTATGRSTTSHARAAHGLRHGALAQRAGRDVQTASAYLGVPVQPLLADLRVGQSLAQVARATSGRSVAGLEEALVRAKHARLLHAAGLLEKRVHAEVARAGGPGARGLARALGRVGPMAGLFAASGSVGVAAAAYLGISAAQLRGELETGKALADIARESGRSQDGLIAVLTAAKKRAIAAQTAAGAISRTREANLLATLQRRVRKLVQRSFPASKVH